MSTSTKTLLIPALVLLLGALGLYAAAACSSIPEDIGLEDGRLRACPDSPNCVCSEDESSEAYIEPLRYSGSTESAYETLLELLATEPRVEVIRAEPGYVHAVYTSAWLRFRDDVEFRFDTEASAVHVRSASRLGHSDLGANRKRIDALRARWSRAQEASRE